MRPPVTGWERSPPPYRGRMNSLEQARTALDAAERTMKDPQKDTTLRAAEAGALAQIAMAKAIIFIADIQR